MHKNIISILLILSATGMLAATEAPDLTSVKQYLKQAVTDGTVAGGSVLTLHKGKDIKPFRIELEKRITASVMTLKENTKKELKQ